MNSTQASVFLLVCALFVSCVLYLARRNKLSLRYTIGWLAVSASAFFGALFSGVVDPLADLLDLDSWTLLVAAGCSALLGIAVQLSISTSGHIQMIRSLSESVALLEERCWRLEQEGNGRASASYPISAPDE